VRIGESEGTVTHISMLTTRLRSVYGEELVLPNTVVMAQTTVNYSRLRSTGGGQLTTDVTIGYDAPWRQVHAMLLRAADKTPGLLRDPAPTVWQIGLEDFYVRYRLIVAVDVPEQRIPVASVLPMIGTVIVEVPNPGHPYGVRGVGETSIVPPLAAVANAVSNAAGVRLTHIPMSPPRLLAAIEEK